MKSTWLIGLAAIVVALLAGYFLQGSHAPSGQPVLAEISAQTLSGLQTEFNRTPARLRVILLLSPT
jgi:hypothetical protein